MGSSTNIIEVSNLFKSYGNFSVLKGLSFTIHKGEVFGFLGPNGAGKSTTIRILTGQAEFEKGEVKVCGLSPLPRRKEFVKRIGLIPDSQNLYENLTVLENLNFFRELYNVDKSRVESLIHELFLEDKRDFKVSELSKGLRQRVLIARAMLHHPDVLFLDEPSSGLDPLGADKVHQFIKKLKDSGVSIFLTSHSMEEVEELCDRIGFLRDGVLIEVGTPNDLKEKFGNIRLKDIFLKLLGDQGHE